MYAHPDGAATLNSPVAFERVVGRRRPSTSTSIVALGIGSYVRESTTVPLIQFVSGSGERVKLDQSWEPEERYADVEPGEYPTTSSVTRSYHSAGRRIS